MRTHGGEPVGTVELARACEQVHPGASYLHAGQAWRVVGLDLDARSAVVEPRRRADLHGRPDRRRHPDPGLRRAATGGGAAGHRARASRGAPAGDGLPAEGDDAAGRSLGIESLELPPSTAADPGVLVRRARRGAARPRASTRAAVPGRCTRPSTPPSGCCRSSPSATGGTSAVCRPPHQRELGAAAIVVYDGYQGGAGRRRAGLRGGGRATWRRRSTSCRRARARRGARRACSRRSAATATTRSTRRRRWPCCGRPPRPEPPTGGRGHRSTRIVARASRSTSSRNAPISGSRSGRRSGRRR